MTENNTNVKIWTPSQREAIESRGVNLLVSAGAGSGKTAVMIERITNLLREGADLSRMLICTFTKTAAADMKRKLSEALASGDYALGAAQKKLPLAEICTLDSWCSHVIKNRFFLSDLSPDFTVLDEGEESALKAEICERVIGDECSSGDGVFAELYEAMLSRRSHAKLVEAVLCVYNYTIAQPYPDKWLGLTAQKTDAEYRRLLLIPIERDMSKLCEQAKSLLCDLGAAGFAADYDALTDVIAIMESCAECTVATPRLTGKPEFKELHERYKKLVETYRKLYDKKLVTESTEEMPSHEQSDPYCRKLGELANKLYLLYGEVKRSRGKADYSDLEHQALKILNDATYGKDILNGYDYVFVDEYQDISPLQEEILSKFDCEMFFVGDVKQSIYGFRMCRPDFFISKRDSYARGAGKTVSLNTNFRSGSLIIDAVNCVFEAVMTKEFGGCDYADDKFAVGKTVPSSVKAFLLSPQEPSGMPLAVYSASNDGCPSDPSTVQEVNAVVSQIISILDEESNDPDSAISYGDIAVLVRKRSDFTDMLQTALRAKSIPVTFVSSSAPADSFVTVSSLISMLRLINNTRDEVSLASVLLSPMFGKFTPEELNELRGDERSFCDCIYGGYDGDPALKNKLNSFKNMLDRFIRAAECSTVAELAGQITGECDCFNYAVCIGGEREAAALDAFGEYLAAADPDDLYGAMCRMERVGVPDIKVSDGGRAVKIMTIHASKGLEFKHVILPCLHKQFNFSDTTNTVICDEREGIVLRTYDLVNRTVKRNPRFAVCASQLKRSLIQEEMRMLYVAMTRAQNGLYLFSYPPRSVRENEDEIAYIDWLYPYLFKNATLIRADEPQRRLPRERNRRPIPEIVDALINNFNANSSVARASSPVKVTVSEIAHNEDEPYVAYADFGENAAQRGTAYHKFMQWADFYDDRAYEKLCLRFPQEAEVTDESKIKLAFKKVGEFIAGRRYAREKQFVYNNKSALIQGVIDLMVFNADGSVDIVDYKTGSEQSVKNNATYVKQLNLYAEAVRNVLKLKVNKTYLYSFDGGNFIEVAPNASIMR